VQHGTTASHDVPAPDKKSPNAAGGAPLPGKRRSRSTAAIVIFLIVSAIAAAILLSISRRPVVHGPATTYVSLQGSDSTGKGTLSAPYRSIERTQKLVPPGGTVYLRAGVYTATKLLLTASGASGASITYAPYPGEAVILDGSGASFDDDFIVELRSVHDVVFTGFEIRNGAGAGGLGAIDGNRVTVSNNRIHNVDLVGLRVTGENIDVTGNEVYSACLTNIRGARGSAGWPAAIATRKTSSGDVSTNVVFRNNYSHDNWGEGIDAHFLAGGVVDSNRLIDNYSVSIYSDDSRDIRIINNYMAVTSAVYNRVDNGRRAQGIVLGSETHFQRPVNMVIDGNVFGGGNSTQVVYQDADYNQTVIMQDPKQQNFR
jgi:hypothetical protein